MRAHWISDANGRFTVPALMPGKVLLHAEPLDPASGRSVWLPARGAPPRLPAGGALEHEFAVERR